LWCVRTVMCCLYFVGPYRADLVLAKDGEFCDQTVREFCVNERLKIRVSVVRLIQIGLGPILTLRAASLS